MKAKPPKTLSREQVRETLSEMPIESVLLVSKSELTPKQREFAKQVALGQSGAEAYRTAYSKAGKKKTHGDNASRLKADERIKAEIEAYKLANEAEKYRSAVTLRNLVLHSLTQVLIDPATKPAQKIAAAKVLGTVTEVAAFTERKEITTISGSEEIKSQIMNQLKGLMLSAGNSGDIVDIDANDLLAELSGNNNNQPENPDSDSENLDSDINSAMDEGYGGGGDPKNFGRHFQDLHTIPHEQSASESIGNPPMSDLNREGEGGIKNLESDSYQNDSCQNIATGNVTSRGG